jgi:hypothetical protein
MKMANISEIIIPTKPAIFPRKPYDFPISKRENLMLLLNHQKPYWMPFVMPSSQDIPPINLIEMPPPGNDFIDMFGVAHKYSEAQGSSTPVNQALSGAAKWREQVKWPDLSPLDELCAKAAEGFKRDETRALTTRLASTCFEHLHFLTGFEQALVDLMLEPDECRAFFEASVDFFIKIFDTKYKYFKVDWVFYNDDWGTAHGPFFSEDVLRASIFEPTKRYVNYIRSKGVKVIFHNCGLVNSWVPIIVEEIGADGLDIQYELNDISGIMKKYGNRASIILQNPDSYFFFDPDVTLEQVREKARYYVDTFGAQTNPGAGGMLMYFAPTEDVYNTFTEEIYDYSIEMYKNLR